MSSLGAFSMWDLFRGEVESQMKVLADSLLALEAGDEAAAHLASAMRAAHSIKGAARIVQLDAAVRLAHVMEDCLVAAQESGLDLSGGGVDVLLSAGDMLSKLSGVDEPAVPLWLEEHAGAIEQLCDDLAQVRSGRCPSPAVPSPEPPSPAPARSVPVAPVVASAEPASPPDARPPADPGRDAGAVAPPAGRPEPTPTLAALLFEVAGQRYGLDVSEIVEVVPAVRLRSIHGVPPYVAGLCRYRGTLVPVLDLSQMLGAPASELCYSTRLVLVRYRGFDGEPHLLGLLIERSALGVIDAPRHLTDQGVATPDVPYLGALVTDGDDVFQLVTVDQLIPSGLRDRLFVDARG